MMPACHFRRAHNPVVLRLLIASYLMVGALLAGCGMGAAAGTQLIGKPPATPVPPLSGVKVPRLAGISMVSSDEGWAIGRDDGFAGVGTFLLRYHQGAWTRAPFPFQSASANVAFSPAAIAMTSAQEGWVGGALHDATYAQADIAALFHYASGTWQQAILPTGLTAIQALAMVAPDAGWALGQTGTGGAQTSQILRYRSGQWTTEATFPASPYGGLVSLSMGSSSDGWAAGGNLLVHYTRGAWTAVRLPLDAGIVARTYTSVSMVSPTLGWAVALDQAADGNCTAECGGSGKTPPVLLRFADGAWQEWRPPSPLESAGGNGSDEAVSSMSVVAVSASELWVADGVITHYTAGQPAEVLRSYCDSLLVKVALVPSAQEGWIIGTWGQLFHYQNGAFNRYQTGLPCASIGG